MSNNDKKQMDSKDLAALIVGIAVTKELPKKTRKELINAIFEAGLGVKDLLPINEEENP